MTRILNKCAEMSEKLSEMRNSDVAGWFKFVSENVYSSSKLFKQVFESPAANKVRAWWPRGTGDDEAFERSLLEKVIRIE